MKKITTTVVFLALTSVAATLFVWWDTAPAHTGPAKYRLGVDSPGPEIRHPMPAGPPLRTYHCDPTTGPKNCGTQAIPAVVRTVPEPGTLALLAMGLGLIAWRARS